MKNNIVFKKDFFLQYINLYGNKLIRLGFRISDKKSKTKVENILINHNIIQ